MGTQAKSEVLASELMPKHCEGVEHMNIVGRDLQAKQQQQTQ